MHWGANAVELEFMRYRPRRELSGVLQQYDLIHVVAGGPALAAAVTGVGRPVVLQVASLVALERHQLLTEQRGVQQIWRAGMTRKTVRVERRVLREVDAILVMNSEMSDYALSVGCKGVVKVYPGLANIAITPPATGWRRDGYILSVCRLNDPRKGIDRLIRACGEMVRADNSVPELILAGRGRLPETLRHLIRRLNLSSRIRVCSDVDSSDLAELYRGASVFIQASYEEGLGLSVLEAMASGVPVVATETAGTRETVIDGVTGWLVSQRSQQHVPRLVAGRALQVLQQNGAAFSLAARRSYLETFSGQDGIEQIVHLYDDLLRPT